MKNAVIDDHRIRVAAERRDRMRKRLLAAVMTSYAERLDNVPPSVDDVVRAADASRATFYKYFNSMEEANEVLGEQLADEMVHTILAIFDGPEEAFFRFSVSVQLFLLRSVIDPVWGGFISRTHQIPHDHILMRGITTHLEAAREQGEVHFVDLDAATSLVIGTMMEGIRNIARSGERNRVYVEEIVAMILRALGVAEDKARAIVRDRSIFIRGLAPDRIAWWRDPWTSLAAA